MSISSRGVKIGKNGRGYFWLAILGMVEVIFTFLLIVSLASNLLFPQQTQAGPGVPQRLSYQGRLTDLSGNALGGTGTNYCFRFSIFDAATGGVQQWPQGGATPSSVTVKVKDGVFNTQVADSVGSLSWGFEDEKNVYLNVEINATPTTCGGSWEALDLRQRIESVAYARVSEYLYSDLAKVASGSGELQLGLGTGSATPVYLSLDWNNLGTETVGASCTNNGSIWYNSADTRARICQGSVIRDMIDGILVQEEGVAVGRASVAFNFVGTNVTALNMNNGVIQVSVGGGGGGGNTLSYYDNFQPAGSLTVVISQSTSMVVPFRLDNAFSASYIRLPVLMTSASVTIATTANTTFSAQMYSTYNAVIYSLGAGANSMSLQSVASGSGGFTQQWSLQANANGSQYTNSYFVSYANQGNNTNTYSTQTSVSQTNFSFATASLTQFTGTRFIDIPFANSLSGGNYWLVYGMSTSSAAQVAAVTGMRVYYSANYAASQLNAVIGRMGEAMNASIQMQLGVGSFTTAGGGTTASLGLSNVSSSASHKLLYFQMIRRS